MSVMLIMICLSAVVPVAGTEFMEEQMIAPKARTVPNLDGEIYGSEWEDARTYTQEMNYSYITGDSHKMVCSLKHKGDYLYMMAKVPDDDQDSDDMLTLLINPSNKSLWTDHPLVIRPDNQNIHKGRFTSDSIFVDETVSYDGSADSTYDDGMYIFEVKLNKTYLNQTVRPHPFNILYADSGFDQGYVVRVNAFGELGMAKPGLRLSPYPMGVGKPGLYVGISIAVILIGLIGYTNFKSRKENKA